MFTEISTLLKEGEMLRINIMKTGETLVVTVLPKSGEVKDPAAEQLIPLNLKGSPEELDAGFIEAVRSPVQKSTGLMTNMAEYEKAAEKAAQESKAVKDRQDTINRHVKEAEAFEKEGKTKEALAAYAKALVPDKNNTKIRLKINALKMKTGGNIDLFPATSSVQEKLPEEDTENFDYPELTTATVHGPEYRDDKVVYRFKSFSVTISLSAKFFSFP
jgi:PRTRC genetic system protein E